MYVFHEFDKRWSEKDDAGDLFSLANLTDLSFQRLDHFFVIQTDRFDPDIQLTGFYTKKELGDLINYLEGMHSTMKDTDEHPRDSEIVKLFYPEIFEQKKEDECES